MLLRIKAEVVERNQSDNHDIDQAVAIAYVLHTMRINSRLG